MKYTLWMALAAAGCEVAPENGAGDPLALELPTDEVASNEQALTRCGFSCPANYLMVGWTYSPFCPGQPPWWNAVECAFNPPYYSISASPQTVVVPAGTLGNTQLCWQTSGTQYPLWITVSHNGQPEQLYTRERDIGRFCDTIPWIQGGSTYHFRIRTQQSGGSVLASTVVQGIVGAPPPPPPPPPDPCTQCPSGWSCRCGDNICRPNNTACP